MSGKKTQNTFKRIEKKFLLKKEQYDKLREVMDEYMAEDDYGLSTICNVYYDTDDFELIRNSIEKPVYKEKLRIRSYGVPDEDTKTFIEIKKKYDGIVYKRRIQLPMKEARKYLNDGQRPVMKSQILNEIDYFLQYYGLSPKMYIAYDRLALFGRQDDSIRITFDQNIRGRETELDLTSGDHGERIIAEDEYLMEVKVPGAYPLWMSKMFTELEIYPTSFSKYGNMYKNKIKQQMKEQENYVR